MKPSGHEAVSPVVGVMLMLVVTIIIAAVVSGFAGGLIGKGSGTAPTLAMDVNVVNTGSYAGSGFFATVTGVSEPIPTKDLKIVTSWTAANGKNPLPGGSTTLPGNRNVDVLFDPATIILGAPVAPFGTGPGINGTETIGGKDTRRDFSSPLQQFGNYSLMAGTTLSAFPCGAMNADSIGGSAQATQGYGIRDRFEYYSSSGDSFADAASAVLGANWEKLRTGDTVTVKVIHVPTGKVIFNQDVLVKGG